MSGLSKPMANKISWLTPIQKEFIIAALKTIQGSSRLSRFAKCCWGDRTYAIKILDELLNELITVDEVLNLMGVPTEQQSAHGETLTILSKEEYALMKHFERMEKTEFMSDDQRGALGELRKTHFSSCRKRCTDPYTLKCIYGYLDPCKAEQCPNQEPMRELTPEELEL